MCVDFARGKEPRGSGPPQLNPGNSLPRRWAEAPLATRRQSEERYRWPSQRPPPVPPGGASAPDGRRLGPGGRCRAAARRRLPARVPTPSPPAPGAALPPLRPLAAPCADSVPGEDGDSREAETRRAR